MSMHDPTPEDAAAARGLVDWALARLTGRRDLLPPAPTRGPLPPFTRDGAGTAAALEALCAIIAPTTIPPDHPRYFAFVPGAPTVAAALADMALSAAMIYGGSRLEAGLAVEAEEAVLRWLADAAGLPASAGGTFVSGGSIANLSALVAARGRGPQARRRTVIVTGQSAHSCVAAAATIMGCDLVTAAPADGHGRLDPHHLAQTLDGLEAEEVVAVVATAGATNTGAFDDLAAIAEVCSSRGLWLHVDGAYGGAALLSPRVRPLLAGIERADSFIVDPHKMLYTPFDCAAVVYRDSAAVRHDLAQTADYLEAIGDTEAPNPSDLAVHLTRRVRGVPLWASVVAYGTEAYTAAVDHCLDIAAHAARRIAASPVLEAAIAPAFTVILVRRRGWTAADYAVWCEDALERGVAMVMPTRHAGEPLLRFCFINPLTTLDDVDLVLEDLAGCPSPSATSPSRP